MSPCTVLLSSGFSLLPSQYAGDEACREFHTSTPYRAAGWMRAPLHWTPLSLASLHSNRLLHSGTAPWPQLLQIHRPSSQAGRRTQAEKEGVLTACPLSSGLCPSPLCLAVSHFPIVFLGSLICGVYVDPSHADHWHQGTLWEQH